MPQTGMIGGSPIGRMGLPAGPPPNCAVEDQPMPVPPAGGDMASPPEAFAKHMLPGEKLLEVFEVRFGVAPLTLWDVCKHPSWFCCPITRPRAPRGLVALTTKNRILQWEYSATADCCRASSSSVVRSYPVADLAHAQVVGHNREFYCCESCDAAISCNKRRPEAAALTLTFGHVSGANLAGAMAAQVTRLPRPVSAASHLSSGTMAAMFHAETDQPSMFVACGPLALPFQILFATLAMVAQLLFVGCPVMQMIIASNCSCSGHGGRVSAANGPFVVSILSDEWELINGDGRGKGRDPRGAPDRGRAFLTHLKRRILTLKANAMHRKLPRQPADPDTVPGSFGPGWRFLPHTEQAPLLTVPASGDPAAPPASRLPPPVSHHHHHHASGGGMPARPMHHGSGYSQLSGGHVAPHQQQGFAPSYGQPLVAPVGGAGGPAAWETAEAGRLLVNVPSTVLPTLPGERILATLPSRRSTTCKDAVAIAFIFAAFFVELANVVVSFLSDGGGSEYPPYYNNDNNFYNNNDDHRNHYYGSGTPYMGLGWVALVVLLGAGMLFASAQGAVAGSGAVTVPGGGALSAFVLTELLACVIDIPMVAISADGGFSVVIGSMHVVPLLFGAGACITVLWAVLTEIPSMGAILLTTHRVASIAIRSRRHNMSGTFDDGEEMAVSVDSFWLPRGVSEGLLFRSKFSAWAEARLFDRSALLGPAGGRDGGGVLRFTPHLHPPEACCDCAGLRRADYARATAFHKALLMHTPPHTAVPLSVLPPPPPGSVMSAAETDPCFASGGVDGAGLAGTLPLVRGEAALAYLDSIEPPHSCGFFVQRALTCGAKPAEAEQRLLLTNRRVFAWADIRNDPTCCYDCWTVRADALAFGSLHEAAERVSVSSGTFLDRCGCLRCPCEPDRSRASTGFSVSVAGVPLRLRRTAGLVAPGMHATPDGHWAGMADAPMLVHAQKVLGAALCHAQARWDAGDGPTAPSAYVDPDFGQAAPLQSAFGSPRGPAQPRPRLVPVLRQQWTALVRSDPPPAPPAAAVDEIFGPALDGSARRRGAGGSGGLSSASGGGADRVPDDDDDDDVVQGGGRPHPASSSSSSSSSSSAAAAAGTPHHAQSADKDDEDTSDPPAAAGSTQAVML